MNFGTAVLAIAFGWLACSPPVSADEPLRATVCQVLEDPGRYNHQLLEISGVVSQGFEDFSIRDEKCDNSIWLEFGGARGSGTIYCCGDDTGRTKRPAPLVVEGIETRLVEDMRLENLQEILQYRGRTHATLVGRYFSGTKQPQSRDGRWGGYGHLGGFTLLVIQEVKKVKNR